MAVKSCGCWGLRDGSLAVGVLFLVITVTSLLATIPGWVQLAEEHHADAEWTLHTSQGTVSVSCSDSPAGDTPGRARLDLPRGSLEGPVPLDCRDWASRRTKMPDEARYPLIFATVYLLVSLGFNVALVQGVRLSARPPLLAWLIFYGAVFALIGLAGVTCFVMGFLAIYASGPGADPVMGTLCIVGGVAGLVASPLLWFWWVVVLGFRRQLCAGSPSAV